jgi:hypothetical protein
MAGLCYVMPVTGHKAYTGKEEEELKYFKMWHYIDVIMIIVCKVRSH